MVDDEISRAVEVLMGKIETKVKELAEMKRTVNFLAREAGMGEPYPESELSLAGNGISPVVRPDQYYGKSPITASREYLEMRGRAVPVEEVLLALERGGFDFNAAGWENRDTRLRFLAISLSKNTAIFHKLPNGTYGLTKFYPDLAAGKKKKSGNSQAADPGATGEETEKG
jgi:hypothetical protein